MQQFWTAIDVGTVLRFKTWTPKAVHIDINAVKDQIAFQLQLCQSC